MSSDFNYEQTKEEIRQFFKTFKDKYFKERNIDELEKIFTKDLINVGTGADETGLTYDDVMFVFKRDKEQCPNELEYRQHSENIIPLSENSGFIFTEIDLYTIINEIPISMPGYRFTVICEKNEDSWKVKHTHISKGEHVLQEGESFPLKEVEERNKLLKQIVKERTKELEEVNKELTDANKDILEIKKKFESIFENVSDGIIVADWPAKKFYMVNQQICELLGYEKEKLRNLWIDDLIPEEHLNYANEQFIAQQSGKKALAEDIPLLTKNNEIKYFDINSKSIEINGKTYYVGLLRDNTEKKHSIELQKEMEVAKKAAEAKDFFLANISHEIRTPVTGIMGMSEILSKTKLDQKQTEYLSVIQESSKILLDLINDILDISKLEAGKMNLKLEHFNLKSMFASLMSLFEPAAQKQDLELSLTYKSAIPEEIKADKKRIEQIIMNLVLNALKYTKEGLIKVIVSAKDIDPGNVEFIIEIVDTGIGITEENQKKLFQKFSQLDNSLARSTSGTGLGLFISKELVKLMNGEIGVDSEPGKGSRFWFTFKAEQISEKEFLDKTSSKETIKPKLGLNVLVVDDKYVNRRVISLMLENSGCKVDVAKDGSEALEVFDPEKHQVIVMDIMMPVMDGVMAMQEIKKQHKNPPPIIAITANAMEGDEKYYIKQGFSNYLSKPITIQDLVDKLQEIDLA